MPAPSFEACESWAWWGVAEYFGGSVYLVYRASTGPIIVRTRVPDGLTTTVATFLHLSDMCSFTVSPATGRWYFHHEWYSQFGGNEETLGFCNATVGVEGLADLSVIQTNSADPANDEVFEETVVHPQTTTALLSISWDQLRAIDPNTGSTLASRPITLEGATIYGARGLATHPITGKLWALLRLSGQSGHELATIDPLNGVATRVGDTGDRFVGLAFDSAGTLYGVDDRYDCGVPLHAL